jgi:hypothetical protein
MNGLVMAFNSHPNFVIALNIIVIMLQLYHSLKERPVLRVNVVKNIE